MMKTTDNNSNKNTHVKEKRKEANKEKKAFKNKCKNWRCKIKKVWKQEIVTNFHDKPNYQNPYIFLLFKPELPCTCSHYYKKKELFVYWPLKMQ